MILNYTNNQAPLLKVNGLSVNFLGEENTVTAVDYIDFHLERGETLGIVGESGSGKSVTALSIMRLFEEYTNCQIAGEVQFQSKQMGQVDLLQLPKKQIRKIRGSEISMIFQDPMSSLNPVYSCGNQVMETILLHENVSKKEAKERTLHLLEQVKLPNPKRIFNKYPHEISGGQKQRIMIAVALSCNPSILIADEPTTALDVTIQADILNLLRELADANGTSIIFISHDLAVIGEITDRVQVMYRGKIVETGSIWDVFSDPKHPYTKGLLACRPRLDFKLTQLPVVEDFLENSATKTDIITQPDEGKFRSVGEAIVINYLPEEDVIDKQAELEKQEPILKVEALSKTYYQYGGLFKTKTWEKLAVNNVSFEVYPGEVLGLVGESGSGKTTLGRSILRLVEPDTGKILFDGKDISDIKQSTLRKYRKDIQIIFQDPYASLNPRMTIGEAITEPMRAHNIFDSEAERKEKAIELLEMVNLNGTHFNRYPNEFSGGQRQRICIARTLAVQPKLIICDESVSALDVSVQASVLNLLNKLKELYKLTYIFISHDLAVVKFMSDRIMVMKDGQIEELDYAENIYQSPKSEYTQKLINSIPKGNLEDIRKAMLKKKVQERA